MFTLHLQPLQHTPKYVTCEEALSMFVYFERTPFIEIRDLAPTFISPDLSL